MICLILLRGSPDLYIGVYPCHPFRRQAASRRAALLEARRQPWGANAGVGNGGSGAAATGQVKDWRPGCLQRQQGGGGGLVAAAADFCLSVPSPITVYPEDANVFQLDRLGNTKLVYGILAVAGRRGYQQLFPI